MIIDHDNLINSIVLYANWSWLNKLDMNWTSLIDIGWSWLVKLELNLCEHVYLDLPSKD